MSGNGFDNELDILCDISACLAAASARKLERPGGKPLGLAHKSPTLRHKHPRLRVSFSGWRAGVRALRCKAFLLAHAAPGPARE